MTGMSVEGVREGEKKQRPRGTHTAKSYRFGTEGHCRVVFSPFFFVFFWIRIYIPRAYNKGTEAVTFSLRIMLRCVW